MPFKFEYNSNLDNIFVKKSKFSFSANLTALDGVKSRRNGADVLNKHLI